MAYHLEQPGGKSRRDAQGADPLSCKPEGFLHGIFDILRRGAKLARKTSYISDAFLFPGNSIRRGGCSTKCKATLNWREIEVPGKDRPLPRLRNRKEKHDEQRNRFFPQIGYPP